MSGVILTQPLASPGGFHQKKSVSNVTTATVIDSVVTNIAEWTVHCTEVGSPTNAESARVYALHNGTSIDYSISSVMRVGDVISGLTFTVALSGSDTLDLNVESLSTAVNVTVRRNFTL